MLKSHADGRVIPTGTMVVRGKSGRLTLDMRKVVVVAYNPRGTDRGDGPVEHFVLSPGSVSVADVSDPGPDGGSWDRSPW